MGKLREGQGKMPVLGLVWDQKVPGSNPGAPTSQVVVAPPPRG